MFARSMKLSTMPDWSGPGRNRATSAIMSSKQSGCSRLMRSFMPRDSSWNTAVVSKRFCKRANGLLVVDGDGGDQLTGGLPSWQDGGLSCQGPSR